MRSAPQYTSYAKNQNIVAHYSSSTYQIDSATTKINYYFGVSVLFFFSLHIYQQPRSRGSSHQAITILCSSSWNLIYIYARLRIL